MQLSKIQKIRYSARILGGIASVFYMYVVFKAGLVNVMKGIDVAGIQYFPFLAFAVAGYMIAYIHERRGGYFMLGGGSGIFIFFLVYFWAFDWARAAAFGIPFILAGAAFVYCNQKDLAT
jgi:hypothetical protein